MDTDDPAVGDRLDIESLRKAYEGRVLTIEKICQDYSIGRRRLFNIRDREGWTHRNPRRIDKRDLVQRMLRLLSAQIDKLEKAMTNPETDESTILNKLVNTLDKLISIKQADAARRPPRRSSKAMTEIRSKVAERLAELRGD